MTPLYGGIDLHTTNSVIALVAETDTVIGEKRLPNDIDTIGDHLASSQEVMTGLVIESTSN